MGFGALNRAHPAGSCERQLEFLESHARGKEKRDEPRAEGAKDATGKVGFLGLPKSFSFLSSKKGLWEIWWGEAPE